jgi:DNA-binding beta-propeller fold protein YncE
MNSLASRISGAAICVALLSTGTAYAQSVEVVASGLNNPRGLAFAPNGDLYVAEAGSGGGDFCHTGPTGPRCFGTTGAILKLDLRRGTREVVVSGLPSMAGANGSASVGPHDVSFQGQGNLFVTIGFGGEPDLREELEDWSGTMAVLGRVTADGAYRIVSDIGTFENEENPDLDLPDTNPYGVLALAGKVIVADAGANALFEISANGAIRTLAVFPEQIFPFPGGPERDAVPTTVVLGPDGDYYVSQLTGGPFTIGAANVFRVPAEGGDPEVVLSGFTNVIDIAFGADGSLYVLQIAEPLFNLSAAKLIRVSPDGTRTTLAVPGLVGPGGLAIAKDGTIYVTNFSISPGGGQILAIRE